jgi:hypothetical protein
MRVKKVKTDPKKRPKTKDHKSLNTEKPHPTMDDLFRAYMFDANCPLCGIEMNIKMVELKETIRMTKEHWCPKLKGKSRFAIAYRKH